MELIKNGNHLNIGEAKELDFLCSSLIESNSFYINKLPSLHILNPNQLKTTNENGNRKRSISSDFSSAPSKKKNPPSQKKVMDVLVERMQNDDKKFFQVSKRKCIECIKFVMHLIEISLKMNDPEHF